MGEGKTFYDILYKRTDIGKHGVWIKCGVLVEQANGDKALKLDVIPTGSWDGWLTVKSKRKKQ